MATEREKEKERDKPPREALKREQPMSSLDRLIAQSIGEEREFGSPEDPARERWPVLWEFLTRVYVGKDRLRTPSRITIQAGPGGIVVTLTDPDLQAALGVATAQLDQALDALEKAAADPLAAWRPWGRKEPQLRKRKKEM